jgi:hypothetical protein
VLLGLYCQRVCVLLKQGRVVLLGGLDYAFRGCSPRAEGAHEGAVLAAQDHYVRVGLVQVVVELGKVELLPSACHVLLIP